MGVKSLKIELTTAVAYCHNHRKKSGQAETRQNVLVPILPNCLMEVPLKRLLVGCWLPKLILAKK